MASDDIQFCTDEELLMELKKLGYSDVSAEAFLMVKKDLSELMLQEKGVPRNSQKYHELTSYKNLKYSNPSQNVNVQPTAFLPGRSPTFVIDPDKTSPAHFISSSTYVPDLPQSKYDNLKTKKRAQSQNLSVEEESKHLTLSTSSRISDSSPSDYKNQSRNYRSKESTQFQSISKEKQPENYNLPSNSCILNASPQRFNYVSKEKTQSQKILVEKGSKNANLPSSSRVPNSSLNRNKFEDCELKGRIRQQNHPEEVEQENAALFLSSHQPNSLNECETSSKITQSKSISEEEGDHENADTVYNTSKSIESSGSNISFDEYRERLKTFKAGRESKSFGSPEKKDSSSVSLEGNKIKRKVMRHKNGKPVVTEEYIEIPSIFNTSSTNNSEKSVSSDELSFKTNSSSGSLSAASPETSDTPRSTDSLSSSRSILSRMSMPRKKKSDPVAMYHHYKKIWNEHKPPGEKSHDKLRWAIRDRMLEYSL